MCVLIFLYLLGRYYFGYILKMRENVDYPGLLGIASPHLSASLIVECLHKRVQNNVKDQYCQHCS